MSLQDMNWEAGQITSAVKLAFTGEGGVGSLPPHFTARGAGGDDGHSVVKQPGWLRSPYQPLEDKN